MASGNESDLSHSLSRLKTAGFCAECPALPEYIAQGWDEKEALDNIKEAITAWLSTRQKALQNLINRDNCP